LAVLFRSKKSGFSFLKQLFFDNRTPPSLVFSIERSDGLFKSEEVAHRYVRSCR
jgi:hypothetical protein